MKQSNRTKFCGFTTTDKLYVAVIVLLVFFVLSELPPYSVKNSSIDKTSWSLKSERIISRSLERLAYKKFAEWASNPLVVNAVKQANGRREIPLDEVIKLDEQWINGEISQDRLSQILDNPCSRYLRQLQKEGGGEDGLYAEIFVTDNRGCLVAASNRTSDFWQGDEDKFVKAFAKGRGDIFIAKAAYDESTHKPLIQISVPVLDPNTSNAIGVMVVGLNMNLLDE